MRDGLPVVSLVVSCLALLIALIGIMSPASTETPQAPEEMLEDARKKLDTIEKDRQTMRRQITELGDNIVQIKEASAGARGEAFDKVEVENIAKKIVEERLAAHIKGEAARVGAQPGTPPAAPQGVAPPPAAPKPGPAPEPAPPAPAKSPRQVEFERMLQTIRTDAQVPDAKMPGLTSVLSALRDDLNAIYGEAGRGAITTEERDKKSMEARKKCEDGLATLLSKEELERLQGWRTTRADEYAKRFFGL